MKIKKKKLNNKGFTLIEILVAMVIFGFLIYVITSLLIVVINTVYTINLKAILRNDLESVISIVTEDLQFASNPTYCSNGNQTCITFSYNTPTAGGGSEVTCETIGLVQNGNLSNIVKVVNINTSTCPLNGSAPGSKIYYLNAANTKIPSMYFDIEQGNILFSMTGQVDDRLGNPIFPNGLAVAANIQYNKK